MLTVKQFFEHYPDMHRLLWQSDIVWEGAWNRHEFISVTEGNLQEYNEDELDSIFDKCYLRMKRILRTVFFEQIAELEWYLDLTEGISLLEDANSEKEYELIETYLLSGQKGLNAWINDSAERLFGVWGRIFIRELFPWDDNFDQPHNLKLYEEFSSRVAGKMRDFSVVNPLMQMTDKSLDVYHIDLSKFSIQIGSKSLEMNNTKGFQFLIALAKAPGKYCQVTEIAEEMGGDALDDLKPVKCRLNSFLIDNGFESLASQIKSKPGHYALVLNENQVKIM